MMMFIGHAEQVAFIVKMHLSFRLNQQEAVHRAAFRLQCCAPGDQRVGLLRFGMHPGDHLFLRH
jgi:predicted small integral membrane protein